MKFFGLGLKGKLTRLFFPHIVEKNLAREREIFDKLSVNGIFIIGHTRSGTTVLQDALNSCPDIFIMWEGNLHANHHKKNFSAWNRGMHKRFNHPARKSYTCPIPDDAEGDGFDVMLKARRSHKYVGDKLAFRNEKLGYDFDACYAFFIKYFWKSCYLCTIRDPADLLVSNKKMFSLEDLSDYAGSYLQTCAFVLSIYTTFDNAFVFALEDMNQGYFDRLGERLGCDLSSAHLYYDKKAQQAGRHGDGRDGIDPAILERLEYYYQSMRKIFSDPFDCKAPLDVFHLQNELSMELRQFAAGAPLKTESVAIVEIKELKKSAA